MFVYCRIQLYQLTKHYQVIRISVGLFVVVIMVDSFVVVVVVGIYHLD